MNFSKTEVRMTKKKVEYHLGLSDALVLSEQA